MATVDGRVPTQTSAVRTVCSRFGGVVVAGLLVALAVTGTMRTTSDLDDSRSAFSTGDMTISDDDAASALFDASNLAPGKPISNCISVSFNGNGDPMLVRLRGQSSGALDRHLALTIEMGTGGRYNHCGSFRGAVLYNGTLADFVAGHQALGSGLATFSPSGDDARTFRFTVGVADDPAAQGASAKAGFAWEAQAAPAVVPPPTGSWPAPSSPPSPSSGPAPKSSSPGRTTPSAPSTRPDAARDGTARDPGAVTAPEPQPVEPLPSTVPGAPAGGAATSDANRLSSSNVPGGKASQKSGKDSSSWEALQQFFDDALQIAVAVGKGAAPSAVLLGIVLLFLAFQDRVDRKDPKLALAPVHAEPHLTFAPRGGIRP